MGWVGRGLCGIWIGRYLDKDRGWRGIWEVIWIWECRGILRGMWEGCGYDTGYGEGCGEGY